MEDTSNESGTIATHLSSCHWPSRDATSGECSANQQLDNPAQFYSWPVQQQLICALYKWSGTIVFIQYQWRAIAKSISMPCYLSLTQRDLNCFPKSQMNCRCFLEISNIFSSGVSISNRRISMMRLFLCKYMTDCRKFHIYTHFERSLHAATKAFTLKFRSEVNDLWVLKLSLHLPLPPFLTYWGLLDSDRLSIQQVLGFTNFTGPCSRPSSFICQWCHINWLVHKT